MNDTFEIMEQNRRDPEPALDEIEPVTKDRKGSEFVFALTLALIFLATAGQTISNHEMWRDETQAWMIARDSESLPQLMRNLRYDGHPPLWHIGLYGIQQVWDSLDAMRYFHLLIAAATVFVFAVYAPLPRLLRGMFAFGYYPFYEYAAISRNYALGFLLLLLFCVVYRRNARRMPLAGALLFLAAMTSVHATICVIAIIIGLCAHYGWRLARGRMGEGELKPVVIGLAIAIVGVAASAMIMKPPEDSGFAMGWFTEFNHERWLLIRIRSAQAFFPLVEYRPDFWESNILNRLEYAKHINLGLGVFMILWGASLFARRPYALLTAFAGAAGLMTFFYIKYPGSQRHHGFLFVIFIVSLWLSREGPGDEPESGQDRFARFRRAIHSLGAGGVQYGLLFILFAANIYGGIVAGAMDMNYTFSAAQETAEYIRESGLDRLPIVGNHDTHVSAVTGHLGREIRYARANRDGSFIIFDQDRLDFVGGEGLMEIATGLCEGEGVLLALHHAMPSSLVEEYDLRFLRRFRADIRKDESYHLYLLPPQGETGGGA